jgi:tetratricopeptide (TPR) repeat protein
MISHGALWPDTAFGFLDINLARRTMRLVMFVGVLFATVAMSPFAPYAGADDQANPVQGKFNVPLFDGLGTHTRNVTTSSADAQRYFNQGLCFLYAFNHDEAIRSFQQATEIDPKCCMAWWGISLANGPHINNPVVTEERAEAAWKALVMARDVSAKSGDVEKALLGALSKRYAKEQPEDRAPLDAAYADAMREVWKKYPQDADIGALFAESMMDLRPWDLWTLDGKPQPGTEEIVSTLEAVLGKSPYHPLALHLYMHAVEASPNPEKADCARWRRAWGTWSTCPRTSTSAAAAGRWPFPPMPRPWKPTASTAKSRRSKGSTASTWRTTITCFRSPR